MKQFEFYGEVTGNTYGPFTETEALDYLNKNDGRVLSDLEVHDSFMALNGTTWARVSDLVLQDDVPLTVEDVTACRESAVRVRYKLRLERIATHVFASMVNASPMLSDTVLARTAVDFAKALIAELDKQS